MKPIDKIVNEAMSGITPANAAIEQQEATHGFLTSNGECVVSAWLVGGECVVSAW